MRDNLVAKYAHLYNKCKAFSENTDDSFYVVTVTDAEVAIRESESFSSIQEATRFAESLSGFGSTISVISV